MKSEESRHCFANFPRPDIPDAKLVVIGDAAKEGLMEQMPGDVLHHGGVPGEHALGVDHLMGKHYGQLFLIRFVNLVSTWLASTVPLMSQRQRV